MPLYLWSLSMNLQALEHWVIGKCDVPNEMWKLFVWSKRWRAKQTLSISFSSDANLWQPIFYNDKATQASFFLVYNFKNYFSGTFSRYWFLLVLFKLKTVYCLLWILFRWNLWIVYEEIVKYFQNKMNRFFLNVAWHLESRM